MRSDGAPRGYRIEHRDPNRPPRALAVTDTLVLAQVQMMLWAMQLSRDNVRGEIVVINRATGEVVDAHGL